MEIEVEQLKKEVEKQLNLGPSEEWDSRDFEQFSRRISDQTNITLSESTLRRIWGKAEYTHQPSQHTLDVLSQFAGFESWKKFKWSVSIHHKSPSKKVYEMKGRRIKLGLFLATGLCAVIIFATWLYQRNYKDHKKNYVFKSDRVSRGIPNTVVFHYKTPKHKTGQKLFIQQSWDPRTRTEVSYQGNVSTSVYYRPGFFHAKLIEDKSVVSEHPLLIPTQGWLCMIATDQKPIYFPPSEFVNKGILELKDVVLRARNIDMHPGSPNVEYYNVGNFKPISSKRFIFRVNVKRTGLGVCKRVDIILFTDSIPIIIPLSIKGCTSEVNLFDGSKNISGKTTDLSGFGIDNLGWIGITCEGSADKITYSINDKLAYVTKARTHFPNILGIGFMFEGQGAVKGIQLQNEEELVYKAF